MGYDVAIVGHITRDRIVIPGQPLRGASGGAVQYAGHALAAFGRRVLVVTRCAAGDEGLVKSLRDAGVEVRVLPSPSTTVFVNEYAGAHLEQRTQRVESRAAPFTASDLDGVDAEVLVFGGLTQDEFPIGVVEALAQRFALVAADLQGFLRRVVASRVVLERPADLPRLLAAVDVLKADETEAALAVGLAPKDDVGSLGAVARSLVRSGVQTALVTAADRGSHLTSPAADTAIAAFAPASHVDATGCGDTYLAAFIHARLDGRADVDAAHFAAAAASVKLEGEGPLRARPEMVEDRVARAP